MYRRTRAGSHAATTILAGFLVFGPAANPAFGQTLGQTSQPIIYGEDDRIEVFEVADPLLRRRAVQSTVSFMYRRTLSYESDGSVALETLPYDQIYNLCEGEPFAGQPAAAWCTGVLIDEDLVLTAGHCLGEKLSQVQATCDTLTVVFGYHYDQPGSLAPIRAEDVFRCRQVVAWQQDSFDLNAPDYAVVQLDRSATPEHEVAPIRLDPVQLDEGVVAVTHGAGLPAKVDRGGEVVNVSTYVEYFQANTDTFEGASGSPLFDESSLLVGLHTRGNADWEFTAQCTAAVVASNGAEDHQVLSSPVEDLCGQRWPSERLCGIAPSCGDGVCSSEERNDTCPEDCAQQLCGDGVCERDEPGNCSQDCGAFAHVPESWTCAPEYYQDFNGCDCGCGAWDPDCDDATEQLLNCAEGAVCVDDGECAFVEEAPATVRKSRSGGCSVARAQGGPLNAPFGVTALSGIALLLCRRQVVRARRRAASVRSRRQCRGR